MDVHDNYPGVYLPTKDGEQALEKWDAIPNKAA